MEDIQPKSTRTYEEWKEALIQTIHNGTGTPVEEIEINDELIRPKYEDALSPFAVYLENYRNK